MRIDDGLGWELQEEVEQNDDDDDDWDDDDYEDDDDDDDDEEGEEEEAEEGWRTRRGTLSARPGQSSEERRED